MEFFTTQSTPLGPILLASDGVSLTGAWFQGQKYYPTARAQSGEVKPELLLFRRTEDWLAAYFAGARPPADALPLSPLGTAFQKLVWQLLREIPYGETISYGQLAEITAQRLGRAHMSA